MNRGESRCRWAILPLVTISQRPTPSAVAQPTHEPVWPWSPTFHQVSRRSWDSGSVARAASMPPATASSKVQSRSVPLEGTRLQMRFLVVAMGRILLLWGGSDQRYVAGMSDARLLTQVYDGLSAWARDLDEAALGAPTRTGWTV